MRSIRSRSSHRLLIAAAILAGAVAAPAAAEVVREFDAWRVECAPPEPGSAEPRRCAARAAWRGGISLFVIRRGAEHIVVVQQGPENQFERGDSVALAAGAVTQSVTPQRRQAAVIGGAEAAVLVRGWSQAEAKAPGGLLDGGNAIIVQVRQARGGGRIARFPLAGFSQAMAALVDLDAGRDLGGDAAPADSGDDLLSRLLRMFR